jgi:hypothetical protein
MKNKQKEWHHATKHYGMFNLTVLEENNFTNRRRETHSAFDLRGLKTGHLGTVMQYRFQPCSP